jgi:hypothetical protein
MKAQPALCFLALSLAGSVPAHSQPAAAPVMQELARRSGLGEPELTLMLDRCEATQQNMYFCAWRDLIAVELDLDRLIGSAERQKPSCAIVQSDLTRWKQRRDHACETAARREWGEGSMSPTAQLLCEADATRGLADRLKAHPSSCSIR